MNLQQEKNDAHIKKKKKTERKKSDRRINTTPAGDRARGIPKIHFAWPSQYNGNETETI